MTVAAGALIGRAMRLGRMLLLCAWQVVVPATGSAQDPVPLESTPFVVGEDPEGRVVDQQGMPIAGARIEVICVGSPKGYLRALHEALLQTPLLPAFSGRDGSYVLPLTEVHRQVYGAGPGEFVLQVSRPGYETGRESLSGGLHAYLGSEVELTSLESLPRLSLTIEEPMPGMIFAVENPAMDNRPQQFAVGSDGQLTLHLALVPKRTHRVSGDLLRPWYRRGQLLYPGRSSRSESIDPGGRSLQWQSVDAPKQEPLQLLDQDGKALDKVWGIYETNAGHRMRFEFAGSQLPRDASLTLRHVGAEGMLSQGVDDDPVIALEQAPQHLSPLTIQVRDQDGYPVGRVTAILWPLEKGIWAGGADIPRPLAEVTGSAGGNVNLPARLLGVPARLELRAPGYLPMTYVEPRQLHGLADVELERIERGGRVTFEVRNENGERIAGAMLFLSDRAYGAGGLPFGLLRSDEHGRIDLGTLRAGDYRYHCVSTNRVPAVGRIQVTSGQVSKVVIEFSRAQSIRLLTFDKHNRLLPFAQVNLSQISEFGRNSQGTYRSDSLARIWIRGLHQDSIIGVNQRVLFAGGREQLIDPGLEAVEPSDLYPIRRVLLKVPDGRRITRLMTSYHSGGAVRTVRNGQAYDGASALLIDWAGVAESEMIVGFDAGPPARILGSEVKAASAGRVLVIDRSEIVRRQRLNLLGMEGADLRHLRIQPINIHGGRSALSNRSGQMVELDESGDPWFVARDQGAYRCQILHPEYLLRETTIPSREASDGPIVIRLAKGTPLSFKGPWAYPDIFSGEMLTKHDFNLTIQGKGRGSRIRIQNSWAPQQGRRAGEPVLIPCPVALVPGEYEIALQLGPLNLTRRILALPQVPVIIDLGKD